MLEILKFIFSSFWIFLGVLILLSVALDGFAAIFRAFFHRNK